MRRKLKLLVKVKRREEEDGLIEGNTKKELHKSKMGTAKKDKEEAERNDKEMIRQRASMKSINA